MSDLWSDNVAPSLHRIKFGYRADPTSQYGNPEQETSRADGIFVYGGMGGYIEIKSARGMSFDMRIWRDDQRQWWEEWCTPYNIPLFIWLNLGGSSEKALPHIKLNFAAEAYPRKAWLIPATKYREVQLLTESIYGQHSLPYHAKSGMSTGMQVDKWDALRLFADYELKWLGNKTWDVPPWLLLSQCANKTRITITDEVEES